MLELKNITKDYDVAGDKVHALKGVSVNFRKNEFVSILGASGCGKTTLLNIIGGLDKYTSGDLVINGISTKNYKDRDWDTYRNHSIGFIFQSYHLIPHQTVLQNVELALTISGVDKDERRKRAVEALGKVGLADKIKNRPNQLSGGQAQRVAIARALINDPEIVLADEPTGALDSKTSVQIMELLKEISRDRLVIMVTHNPELAEKYSTRIIRLLDGEVIDDSMPYTSSEGDTSDEKAEERKNEDMQEGGPDAAAEPTESGGEAKATNKGKKKKTSMSVGMAFGLSLKNLLSKRKRTAMVSVAGSIGIIGVSMVLAISAGVQNYIKSMENDLLSGYPLTVTETAIDFDALIDFANSTGQEVDLGRLKDKVYVDSLLETLMSFAGSMTTNVISEEYSEYVGAMPEKYYNALQFGYDFDMSNYIYTDFSVDGQPEHTENASVTAIRSKYMSVLSEQEEYKDYAGMIYTVDSLKELPDNADYILGQYDVLASVHGTELSESDKADIFDNKNSLVMVINENAFSDLNFGQYGYMTEDEFLNFAYKAEGSEYDEEVIDSYNGKDFSFFIGESAHSFKWYPNDVVYSPTTADDKFDLSGMGVEVPARERGIYYKYNPTSDGFDESLGEELKVKAILQKKDNISYGCLSSGLYYGKALTDYTIEKGKTSAIAAYLNSLTADDSGEKTIPCLPYNYEFSYYNPAGELQTETACGYIFEPGGMMDAMMPGGGQSQHDMLKVTLNMLAGTSLPTSFKIYPLNFDSKDLVTNYLDRWNEACKEDGSGEFTFKNAEGTEITVTNLGEDDKVKYTDTVGLIITMVNTMIEMITVALVAFTALSLVVSTVMVGIITYVSVVERIKEIGILRAVGARKKDIKRLFNAETFIIGLAAGAVGIGVTYIISLILNLVIGNLFGIFGIAALPWWQAIVMICVSVALTLVSGLIPAAAAAKKDPVVALRTE